MIGLLLRCYPAAWRARYADEFTALLEQRPLGPFDVADVLLGAVDAHLHLRGHGAASEHRKGFAMSLRIGGYAAIAGGMLWFVSIAVGSAMSSGGGDSSIWFLAFAAASVLLLVALVGLSAFQARRNPRLVWAAFAIPAGGAIIATLGVFGMLTVGDAPFIGLASPWNVWIIGLMAMILGSSLFGIATVRTGSLSRAGAILLVLGAFAVLPALGGMTGAIANPQLGIIFTAMPFLAFAGGWIWLGASALRFGSPTTTLQGAM